MAIVRRSPARASPTRQRWGAVTTASALLTQAVQELAGAPREGLGEEKDSRWRGRRIVRVGEAWHLGVILLTDTHALATAEVLRAADPGRRGYTAESARARAERRALALRGGFHEGMSCTSAGA